LAIGGSMKGPATVAMAAPLAIWALPIIDSMAAITRRKLTGRSIYATDRGHLHHRLMSLYGKNSRVLAVVAVCCAVTCAGALISTFMNNDLAAILAVVSVLLMLVATQAFGHVEFLLVIARLKSLVLMKFCKSIPREYSFRLQGSHDWNMMWQSVIEFAEKFDLVEVKIDLNLAAIQEGFHATWRRPSASEKQERWSTDVPLFVEKHLVGRIWMSGVRSAGMTSCETIQQFLEILEPLEAEIVAQASNPDSRKNPSSPLPVPASGTSSELSAG
jgi:UDP-GlcNAc:undecaprenyl-phosphate GlcNAc-1-phosphate transferase